MPRYVCFTLLFLLSCSTDKGEGDVQGDCLDGEDNDDDGYTDCYDDGCDGKPACVDVNDTGSSSNTEPADGWGVSSCSSGGSACWFGDITCVDYSRDAASWCAEIGGDYQASACGSGADALCDIPAGGSEIYEQCATTYYYDHYNPAWVCSMHSGTLYWSEN